MTPFDWVEEAAWYIIPLNTFRYFSSVTRRWVSCRQIIFTYSFIINFAKCHRLIGLSNPATLRVKQVSEDYIFPKYQPSLSVFTFFSLKKSSASRTFLITILRPG